MPAFLQEKKLKQDFQKKRINTLITLIESELMNLTEYYDAVVCRINGRAIVLEKNHIRIRFWSVFSVSYIV